MAGTADGSGTLAIAQIRWHRTAAGIVTDVRDPLNASVIGLAARAGKQLLTKRPTC
jgi:hypothetical protein